MPDITQIPAPRVSFIDPRTNLMAREWYRFFLNLYQLTGNGTNEASLTDLQLGPETRDLSGEIGEAITTAELFSQQPLTIDQIAEMMKRVEALEASAAQAVPEQVAEMSKRVDALESAPPNTPHLRRTAYGSFYDTTTQTAAAINTAYAMTFNSTDLSLGVTIGSPTSRVYVDRIGVYNIQFSAQLDNTSGGNHLVYIWLRINGVDVANSASQVRLKGTDGELVAAWNFVSLLNAGDYFELMWSVSDTAVQITAAAAAAPVPAIPSVILTVTDNISINQY